MRRTVNAGLEVLMADFAGQFTSAALLVKLDCDGVFMVTEQTWERSCQWFALFFVSLGVAHIARNVCAPSLVLEAWMQTFVFPTKGQSAPRTSAACSGAYHDLWLMCVLMVYELRRC